MKKLKNNNGISLIGIILLMLILILVVFLVYEIVYVDVFDINWQENKNPIESISEAIGNFASDKASIIQNNNDSNIEKIEPLINENSNNSVKKISTNHYYYNQLDEYAKIIYDGIESNIDNMKSGTYKIDFGTKFNTLLNQSDGEHKLNIAFQSAWNAFTYDYPEIFYIDVSKLILTTKTTSIGSFSTHKVSLSNDSNENYFTENISSREDILAKEKYLESVKQKIIESLKEYSKYDQIKYIHNWLIDNLKYDTTYKKEDIHNVYGALAKREVVCEGYARTLKYLLDGLEIENVLVSGTATNSNNSTESHAWNYVKLNDKWYAIDVTWDDPIIKGGGVLSDKLRYQYFLKGADNFLKNHNEDGYLSQNSMKFEFPKLYNKDYNK